MTAFAVEAPGVEDGGDPPANDGAGKSAGTARPRTVPAPARNGAHRL